MALLTFRDKYVLQSGVLRSFSSSSLADDAYASQTITLSATQTVLVMYQTNNSYGSSGAYYGYTTAIKVDSTDYGYCYNRPENNDSYSISGYSFWIGSLASGTHTITGRYASNNNTSTTFITNSTLLVYIFDGDEFNYVEDSSNLATTNSPSLVDDPYASFSFTPSGECIAVALYNVTNNNSVVTDTYYGKAVALNILNGSEYMGVDKFPIYISANDNEASHGLAIFADSMPSRPTTIKGRFSCPSGNTVSIQRRQLGYLLLDPSVTTLDWSSSTTTTQVASVNASIWGTDSQLSINRTIYGGVQNFLIQATSGRAYAYSGDNHNEGWSYGLTLNGQVVSYVRHSVYSEDKGLNMAVCYGGLATPSSYTITGVIGHNRNELWNSSMTYRHAFALWMERKYATDTGGADLVAKCPSLNIVGAAEANRASSRLKGPWVTSYAYKINDHVTSGIGYYICIADHTSGTNSEPGVGSTWSTYWKYNSLVKSIVAPFPLSDMAMDNVGSLTAPLPSISSSTGYDIGSIAVPMPDLNSSSSTWGSFGATTAKNAPPPEIAWYESYYPWTEWNDFYSGAESEQEAPVPTLVVEAFSTCGRLNETITPPRITGSGKLGGEAELVVLLNYSGSGHMDISGSGSASLVPNVTGSGLTTLIGDASLEMPCITTSGYSAIVGAIDLPTIDVQATGTVAFTGQSEDEALTIGLSLSASGTVTLFGEIAVHFVQSLSSAGVVTIYGSASLGVGEIEVESTGVVPLYGTGEVKVVGRISGTGTTTLFGQASLGLISQVSAEGFPELHGESEINPILSVAGSGTATIFGYGTQKAVFGSEGTGVVPINGSGSVGIVLSSECAGTTVLFAEAELGIIPDAYGTGLVPYNASCYLNVRQNVSATGRTTLFGNADLQVFVDVNGSKNVSNIVLDMPAVDVSGSGTVGIIGQGSQQFLIEISADGLTTILGSGQVDLPSIDVSSSASSGISGISSVAVFIQASGTGITGAIGSAHLESYLDYQISAVVGAIGSGSIMLMPIEIDGSGYISTEDQLGDAIVLNVYNHAIWNYTNYAFNSFAKMNGFYLGAKDDGLYILEGDTDDGDPINAIVRSGLNDMDSMRMKNMPSIYIAYESDGELSLKTIRDEEKESDPEILPEIKNLIHPRRVRLPRGHVSKYFGWELRNILGSDFQVDAIDLEVEIKSRGVKGK